MTPIRNLGAGMIVLGLSIFGLLLLNSGGSASEPVQSRLSRGAQLTFGALSSRQSELLLKRRPTPPDQPEEGPAGSRYPHGGARHTVHGRGPTLYHLFEPADPTPREAEVLLYFHGRHVIFPPPYWALITHTVRMGYTVIFHTYGQIPGANYQPGYDVTSAAVLRDALERLRGPGHVSPKSNRIALAGHSSGAWIILYMAKQWERYDLPEIAAIVLQDPTTLQKMFVEPDTLTELYPIFGDEMRNIPPSTHFVYITCEETRKYHEEIYGMQLFVLDWPYFDHIPCDRKNFIEIPSDFYGVPILLSHHLTGITNIGSLFLDQIDYGFWKLSMGLLNLAFEGTDGEYVIGNGPKVRDMQRWSDGRPVNKIKTAVEFFGERCLPVSGNR